MGVIGYATILLVTTITYLVVMIGKAGWNEHKRRKRIKAYNQRKAAEKKNKEKSRFQKS